jgi:hypothetical protein
MKHYILSSLFAAMLCCSFSSFAQPDRRDRRFNDHDLNRCAYPSGTAVSIVAALPFGAVAVSFGSRPYHYYDGYYYRPYGYQYMMVAPPVGIVVPALPSGYVSVMIGTRVYYSYQGVFYLPVGNNYQVVQKPEEEEPVAKTNPTGDSEYEKIILEGKTYYKKGSKYYKATVNDNGEISYKEIGESGK